MPLPVPAGYVLTALNSMTGAYQDSEFEPPPTEAAAQTIFHPVGRCTLDVVAYTAIGGLSLATTEVSEEARAIYLGRAGKAFTAARVVVDVLTNAAACDWAEVAILTGTPVLCAGPSSLTVLKAQSAMADWAVIGPQFSDLALTIAPGDHLWLGWCSKFGGGLGPAFRAFLPDDKLSGLTVNYSGTRLTTLAGANNWNRLGATTRTMDSLVGCS